MHKSQSHFKSHMPHSWYLWNLETKGKIMRHITDVHAHVLNYMYLDVLKIKHVSLHKCVLNLLICPRDEKLVVVVGLK